MLLAAFRFSKHVRGPLVRRAACICRSLKAPLGSELSSAVSCVWALIVCHKTPIYLYETTNISRKLGLSYEPPRKAGMCSFSDFGSDILQSHHIIKLALPLSRQMLHASNGGFVSMRALILIGLSLLCSQRPRCCTVGNLW
ncbi:hypothetical protein CI102_13488 [Trichoderma harzianum]|nr:hypothetical protein CI102_13488 [Trichoderma harzianum]